MGVRRGRPRLKRAPLAPLLVLALVLGAAAGCVGLSEDEEARLNLHRENSLSYYERGEYVRALHQSDMALELDDDLTSIHLVRAFCLLKLGKQNHNVPMLDEALTVFDDLRNTRDGAYDFRVHLGLGSALLARALHHEREIGLIDGQLASDFLSPDGREDALDRRADETELRDERLRRAEDELRQTLDFDLQADNAFAIIDLVLVITSLGERDAEVVGLAERALALLEESTGITRMQLDRNARLSPAARIDLQNRIDNNREKERLLRDMIATVYFNRGDTTGFLEQMRVLQERDMIGEAQYYNLAAVHEQLGMYDAAILDLQALLRLRVRRMDYAEDELAPEIFRRIEELKERHGEPAPR